MLFSRYICIVQDAPAYFRHPFHDCCVVPWWFRGPTRAVFAAGQTVDRARGVVHLVGTSSTCAPSPGLVPERTVRTKGSRLFLVVPVCCLGRVKRVLLRAHRCSCCNGKPVSVGPNQFARQRAPFFIVSLRRTELCIDSSSGSPAIKQCLAPGFSDAVRHQPVRLVEVFTFRVQVNDTTQLGVPSPVRRLLTSQRTS